MAAALAASNPTLYRHLALYLQVLRQVLPKRAEQACFHLATQVHPQRYAALPAPERAALHRRILSLVQRCSSLLTVEQLAALADQMDQEAQVRQRRQQRQLLEHLSSGGGSDDADDEEPLDRAAAEPPEEGALGEGASGLPTGSIRLDFSLPLSADIGSWRAMGPPSPGVTGFDLPGNPDAQGLQQALGTGAEPGSQGTGTEAGHPDATGAGPNDPDRDSGGEADDHDTWNEALIDPDAPETGALDFDAISSYAWDSHATDSDAIDPHAADSEAGELAEESLQQRLSQGPDAAAILKIVREAMEDSRDPGHQPPSPHPTPESNSPWREARLPRDPVTLLRWLDGLEKALLRRLRNLSHALNVELMRVGIIRGLLPVSLLDAVLEGQVDTMASPSNVLHLQLPFSLRPGLAEVHALVILLRPVDLEMDEPRLRTCRRRLQQQRQELRRMAHQFRRLQRRLQAHEAERLWLQDIHNSHPPQI